MIRRFCCDSAQRAKRFGRFVPLFIQWTDLMHRSKFIYLQLRRTLDTLLRNDVLYITVSQNDDGIGLSYDQSRPGDFAADRWPNLLVASSGGVGHIPIPLIKGEVNATAAQPTFGSERALTFFAGLLGRLAPGACPDHLQAAAAGGHDGLAEAETSSGPSPIEGLHPCDGRRTVCPDAARLRPFCVRRGGGESIRPRAILRVGRHRVVAVSWAMGEWADWRERSVR